MDTKYFKRGLLLIVALVILSFQCRKKETTRPCYMTTPFSFDVTSEWTPSNEVYDIGDTIYLDLSFPKVLTNLLSNKQISYNNAVGIGGNIFVVELDPINHDISYSMSKFDYISIRGTLQDIKNTPEAGKLFLVEEGLNSYQAKFGIKLKTKGTFLFYVSDLKSAGLKGKNCTNAGFNMLVTNSDKHISLYQHALNQNPDDSQQKTMYCFRVK